jgi:hypothetical protein
MESIYSNLTYLFVALAVLLIVYYVFTVIKKNIVQTSTIFADASERHVSIPQTYTYLKNHLQYIDVERDPTIRECVTKAIIDTNRCLGKADIDTEDPAVLVGNVKEIANRGLQPDVQNIVRLQNILQLRLDDHYVRKANQLVTYDIWKLDMSTMDPREDEHDTYRQYGMSTPQSMKVYNPRHGYSQNDYDTSYRDTRAVQNKFNYSAEYGIHEDVLRDEFGLLSGSSGGLTNVYSGLQSRKHFETGSDYFLPEKDSLDAMLYTAPVNDRGVGINIDRHREKFEKGRAAKYEDFGARSLANDYDYLDD